MRRAVLVGVLAGLTAACTIMNGLKLDAVPTDPTPNGDDDDDSAPGPKKDGATDGGDVSPTGCILKRAPKKPAPTTGGSDTSFSIALRNMLSDNNGPPIGLDLDGLCTCNQNEREACKPKDAATTNCDPATGLDNAGSTLFRGLATGPFPINIVADANERIAEGVRGNLFKIQDYNGTANDDSVTVTFYPSPGITGGPDFGSMQTWPVASSSVIAREAWVAGNELVARFDAIDVFFLDDTPVPAKVRNATVTGTIVNGPTIGNALLVGRVNTTELIQGVGQLQPRALGGTTTLCKTDPYKNIAAGACPRSDLPDDATRDGTDAPCASISIALELRFVPAIVGSTANLNRVDPRCEPSELATCD